MKKIVIAVSLAASFLSYANELKDIRPHLSTLQEIPVNFSLRSRSSIKDIENWRRGDSTNDVSVLVCCGERESKFKNSSGLIFRTFTFDCEGRLKRISGPWISKSQEELYYEHESQQGNSRFDSAETKNLRRPSTASGSCQQQTSAGEVSP